MQQVKAKKALGQHFLTDLTVAQRIADTVSEYRGTPVLEVGPGMGVLTQFLLQAHHDLTVVELDSESVDYLKAAYTDELHNRIVAADFLKLDLKQTLGDGKMVIIGNYPYNISSNIKTKWCAAAVCFSARWHNALPPGRVAKPTVSCRCCCRRGMILNTFSRWMKMCLTHRLR